MASGERDMFMEGNDNMPYVEYEDEMAELPPYQPSHSQQEHLIPGRTQALRTQASQQQLTDARHHQLPMDHAYHSSVTRDPLRLGDYGVPLRYEQPNDYVEGQDAMSSVVRPPPPSAGQLRVPHQQLRPANSVSTTSIFSA